MNSAAAGIIEAEARESLKAAEALEDKFRAAFKVARNHWMFTDKDEQFQAGIGAVYHHATEDEKERILIEVKMLKSMSALVGGLDVNLPELPDGFEAVGISRLWTEE